MLYQVLDRNLEEINHENKILPKVEEQKGQRIQYHVLPYQMEELSLSLFPLSVNPLYPFHHLYNANSTASIIEIKN